MINNAKIIVTSIVSVVVMIAGIIVYVYINSLNTTINDLTSKINDQSNQIKLLNQNIDILEKELESFNSTIEITDDYIEHIKKINTDEDMVKQAIFEEVLNDESDEIKDWLNQKLPENLINTLNTNMVNRMCRD